MSSGHSSSAYSLPWVSPSGNVITAPTIAACQPQNTKLASLSLIRRTWQVRWTTYSDVANSTEPRSEEHTSELQSLMRISYAVFCLKKKNTTKTHQSYEPTHYKHTCSRL